MSESLATGRAKAVEVYSGEDSLPDFFDQQAKNLITFIKAYYRHLNNEFGASYEISNLIKSHDIDIASDRYLDAIERTIAANIPQAEVLDRKRLFKLIANYYNNRGSEESIYTFFKIFYNEVITLIYPKNDLFHTSNDKAVLSDRFRLRDSYKWQEYSYLISSEKDSAEWKSEFLKFVHPAGLKFFTALTIAAVEGDINVKPMWDDGCGGIKNFLCEIPVDPCDFWEYIDWEQYTGRHSPIFQPCVDPNLVYLITFLNQTGLHYVTLLKNIFDIPCPKEVLRAVYPSYTIAFLLTNSPDDGLLKRWDELWRIIGKYLDAGAFRDGYSNYIIEETERDFCLGRGERVETTREITETLTNVYSINCSTNATSNYTGFTSLGEDEIQYLEQGAGASPDGIKSFSTATAITFDPSVPVGTPEEIFQSEYYDEGTGGVPLKFVLPVYDDFPDGEITYEIRLFFAEIYSLVEQTRKFDVFINDTKVLDNYSVFSDVGGSFIGTMKTFYAPSVNGQITISFEHTGIDNDNPKINAFQVIGPYIEQISEKIVPARFAGLSVDQSIDLFSRSYTCIENQNETPIFDPSQWVDLEPDVDLVEKEFSRLIGDGINTQIAVEHNLQTENIFAGVYDTNTQEIVNVLSTVFDENNIVFDFGNYVPSEDEFTIYLHGETPDSPVDYFYAETWSAVSLPSDIDGNYYLDITHNLNSSNIMFSVRDIEKSSVLIHGQVLDSNTLRLFFSEQPQYLNSPADVFSILVMSSGSINSYVNSQIGDGIISEFTIQHNLNTKNILFSVIENSSGDFINVSGENIDSNNLKITFSEIPTVDQYKIYIESVPFDTSLITENDYGLDDTIDVFSINSDFDNSLVYYEAGQPALRTICWVPTEENTA